MSDPLPSPDFISIGAPRAATTWLAGALQAHPAIWVPPCKNIAYFHPRFQMYRLKKFKRFWRGMFGTDNTARWYRRFFLCFIPNVHWYQSLFPRGIVSGEIAESYCTLDDTRIQKLYALNPDLKIIFVMRNPYERALSHAKRGALRRSDTLNEREMMRHINHPSSESRSLYTQILSRWEGVFPADQMFIRFYEDIQTAPETFLNDLYSFLNVPYDAACFKTVIHTQPNQSKVNDDTIPLSIRRYTAAKYRDEIAKLSGRFGGRAKQWLEQMDKILA